jgi:uncharacterized repeat protein (TIGR03943 family)
MAVNQEKNRFSPMNLPLIIMAAWILTSAFLLTDDQYCLFLKPRFGILIHISLFILILFTFSLITLKPKPRISDSLIKGMILLVPVVFIFSAGDRTLGGFALSKRTLATPEKTGISPAPVAEKQDDPEIPGPSILKLVQEWDRYKDTRVTLEGVYYEPREKDETLAVVFRYLVTCCAADALPLGVFMKNQEVGEIKDNDWVRVTGVVKEETLDGTLVIFMALERIEKIPQPSNGAVYLYQ